MTGIETHQRMPITPLTPARVRALAQTLREAGAPALRALAPEARIAAVDRVAASWLADGSPWRRRALGEVSASSGYPAAAVATALDNLWRALRAAELRDALAHEPLGDAAHALPGLAVHVLAGNVPGVGIFGIVAALLAGIPSLVKPATREPVLPELFVDSIATLAPELRPAVAIAPWRGGTAALDAAALRDADLVLAYGRDATLDRLVAHAPRRLLRYGTRLSVALIARSALTRRTARALAEQAALYDQQGCLSPQIACVEESDRGETARFADLVAAELETLERELPRAPATLAESAVVWRFLERARWRAQEGADVTVHGGVGGRASVVCDRSGEWPMSPTFRHLVLRPVATLATAADALARLTGIVEAVGYAGPADGVAAAAAVAATVGASRLCPLERLQAPPFAWRQSGHARLASLVGRTAPAGSPPAFA